MQHLTLLALSLSSLLASVSVQATAYAGEAKSHFWKTATAHTQGFSRYFKPYPDDSFSRLQLAHQWQGIALERAATYSGNMESGDKSLVPDARGEFAPEYIHLKNTASYIGIGVGQADTQYGFGFMADLGVAFGRAGTRLEANSLMRKRFRAGSLTDAALADAEIAWQCRDLDDAPGGIAVWPHAHIGISYRF